MTEYLTEDLAGPLLDYAVALAAAKNGIAISKPLLVNAEEVDTHRDWYSPSMKAEHGWPLIEQTPNVVLTSTVPGEPCIAAVGSASALGPTLLIAFCRAYAKSVMGASLTVDDGQ